MWILLNCLFLLGALFVFAGYRSEDPQKQKYYWSAAGIWGVGLVLAKTFLL